MAASSHDFVAMDTEGCVWGWGVYGWHDGTGNRYRSYPPAKVRIGGESKDTSKPYLCNVQTISRTREAGAAITTDGLVYSWGSVEHGGPGPDNATNRVGAKLVSGLPDSWVEGNRPVALEGGYGTFWVILENGEVWYFGDDEPLAGYHHERPEGDDNGRLSGGRTSAQINGGLPQLAVPSRGLSDWFRANSPDEYIVQIHSGIAFGAALLSTGRVLSWGRTQHFGAIGRQCLVGNTAQREACARAPGLVDFGGREPKIVSISCAFTAVGALAADGVFYGWGKPERSYENLPDIRSVSYNPSHLGSALLPQVSSFGGAGSVVEIARNVVSFQSGQGYFFWQLENGQYWGRGYNSKGQLGNKAGNYGVPGGFNETLTRAVWFTKSYYQGCWSVNQTSPGYGAASKWPGDQIMMGSGTSIFDWRSYHCTDLNDKNTDGTWVRRFTLDQCLAGKCGL
jgi:alpha-tubulin suppressor-like RCC1 family protein